ncbi:MAG: hypothetical protein JWL81_1299, partial [Verrucomicrobiales bacterium]|nr:hypothetical protein [Verrucomicrobiales bacterium]
MSSRYQIQDQISQGGVGIVFRAWDTRLQRAVAIKRFLAPELRSDGGAIDPDLMREATVLSAMQHPNIVSIYDVLPDAKEGPCVVMEYLNGKDLEHAVAEAAMTLADFYKVAAQTLDALSNAHRLNLLHRDIKPANIQVTWLANGTFLCKFVDFGLARFFEKPSKQTVRPDGTVMGSVYYMAPEQLERLALDGRSDLYSLGCVFYYLLSMHRPFEGAAVQDVISAHLAGRFTSLRSYRPQLPPALCQWVHWLMERRPEDRPKDAGEALAALQRIQLNQSPAWPDGYRPTKRTGGIPSAAAAAHATKPVQKIPVRRPRRLRWAVPAMSAAALLGVGLFAFQ